MFEYLKDIEPRNILILSGIGILAIFIVLLFFIAAIKAISEYLEFRRVRKLLDPVENEEKLAKELLAKTQNTSAFFNCFFKDFIDSFDEYESTIIHCYPVFGLALITELKLIMGTEFINIHENEIRASAYKINPVLDDKKIKNINIEINKNTGFSKDEHLILESKKQIINSEILNETKENDEKHIMDIVPSTTIGISKNDIKKSSFKSIEDDKTVVIRINKVLISVGDFDGKNKKDTQEEISKKVNSALKTDSEKDLVNINAEEKINESKQDIQESKVVNEKKVTDSSKDIKMNSDILNQKEKSKLEENKVSKEDLNIKKDEQDTNYEIKSIKEVDIENPIKESDVVNLDMNQEDKISSVSDNKEKNLSKAINEEIDTCQVLKCKNFLLIKYIIETKLPKNIYFYKIIKVFLIKLLINSEFNYGFYDNLVTRFPKITNYKHDLLTNLFIVRDFEKRFCQLEYGRITKQVFKKM